MATIGATVRTILDVAKSLDPDGRVAKVAELLSIRNEVLQYMPWMEGNLPTGHRTTVRTGLPSVTWRLLNNGVTPSKSTKAQIDEQCGKLEAWSECDVAVAKLGGDVGAARLSEAKAFLEAMNQEFNAVLLYGAATTPEKFVGLAPRYSSLSAGNSQNIIDGGGTGTDNTSVYLTVWGDETLTGIYPKGSAVGLQHNDLGEQTVQTSTGIGTGRLRAYQDQFVWDCGIALKDWRYVVRLCNIDISNLIAESSAVDLTNKMLRMIARVPNLNAGRPVFLMNRTVHEMLTIQRRADVRAGGQLSYEVVDGVIRWSFMGIPIACTDSLLNTETRVT
ncbi:MAG: hypothetical protein JWL61_4996 [Gemmatimonadetes bacterium]|nr:hypothetical protein [Gemmatimonadota bacterium]